VISPSSLRIERSRLTRGLGPSPAISRKGAVVSTMSITIEAGGVSQQQVSDTNTPGLDLFGEDRTIVAVRVNGELWDLHRTLPEGAVVEPATISSPDGLNIP